MQIDASSSTSIPDLPPELLLLICEYLLNFSQKAALARLVRCSRETYSLVSPFLYDNITITRAIAGLIFSDSLSVHTAAVALAAGDQVLQLESDLVS